MSHSSTKVTIHIHIDNSDIERVAMEHGWSFARAKRETLKAVRLYVRYCVPDLRVTPETFPDNLLGSSAHLSGTKFVSVEGL